MSGEEPPIRARIAQIVADLNKALAIAREQKVPAQIIVLKLLADPPTYSVALVTNPPTYLAALVEESLPAAADTSTPAP